MRTRVLLCDNDLTTRRSISHTLQKNLFTVEILPQIVGYMDKIKLFDPDIILMDYILQGKTRDTALRLLTTDKETAHIPVVFMAKSEKIIPYANDFNKLYIQKPFDIDQLRAILNMYAIKH